MKCSFVLNNDGYTVERLIHGLEAQYNKVPIWDYGGLSKVFGPGIPSMYHGPIKTCEQLVSFLADPNFGKGDDFEVRSC
jgi:pyruvate decarboxylase